MPLTDLVAPNAIIPALKVNSKKQVLHELAARAAMLTAQNERAIFDILMQREKLGSTAVGNGIAIPHGKLPKLDAFVRIVRAARPADRFRSARQPAGRPRFPAARAGRRRRRSSQGAGAHCAAAARSRDHSQAAWLARRRGALCGAGDAVARPPHSRVKLRHHGSNKNGAATTGAAPLGRSDYSPVRSCSVHADRLELLAPGIGDSGFAAVGEHDRRAVGGVQRKQNLARRRSAALPLAGTCLRKSSKRTALT